jgi:hypothetical protein
MKGHPEPLHRMCETRLIRAQLWDLFQCFFDHQSSIAVLSRHSDALVEQDLLIMQRFISHNLAQGHSTAIWLSGKSMSR